MPWTKYLKVAGVAISATAGLVGIAAGLSQGLNPNTGVATSSATCASYAVLLAHADGAVSVEAPPPCTSSFYFGSMAGKKLNAPIVGMAATPGGAGYWLVASDGGIFTFGNAGYYGSEGNRRLNAPIVGMAATPDGRGYWLVASDGGVFSFGDADYYGSMGSSHLNKPIVGIAADAATGGYWLVASDGGVFAFNAPFLGSLGRSRLNAPIKFITGTPDFGGYRMVGADGGVFDFGDASFYGSAAAPGSHGWDALTTSPDGGGYWLFATSPTGNGVNYDSFGNAATTLGYAGGNVSVATIVGAATIYVGVAPAITTQPSSERVGVGSTASFTAAASGYPTPSVQWQVSTDFGTSYFDVVNANSTTLSFTTVPSENGGEYRAVFTNTAGSVVSSAAILSVGNAPGVTTQPTSTTVNAGSAASFTAAASGTPNPTIQWGVSSNGGTTFTDIPGATDTILSFTATAAENSYEYQAEFTNSSGSVLTNVAVLTVVPMGDVIPSSVGGYFESVSCGSSQDCVAVGGTQGAAALIETSIDGGSTFTTAVVPATAPSMQSVDCNDALHCVAVGGSEIMWSSNGGATWTLVAAPNASPANILVTLTGVACESDTLCTAVGTDVFTEGTAIESPDYIFSTDGGQTWTASTAAPGSNIANVMLSVTCTATVCLGAGQGAARSTDGGATWQAVPTGLSTVSNVSCTTTELACLEIGPSSQTVSTDSGETWTPESSNLPAGASDVETISCPGPTQCMAVGPPPSGAGSPITAVITASGGTGWEVQTGPSGFKNPPTTAFVPYPSVSCASVSSCVVVGTGTAGPQVSVTNNGGETWTDGTVQ